MKKRCRSCDHWIEEDDEAFCVRVDFEVENPQEFFCNQWTEKKNWWHKAMENGNNDNAPDCCYPFNAKSV